MAEDSRSDRSVPGSKEQETESPPEKMDIRFYAALGLVCLLFVMTVVVSYPASRANAGLEMTEKNWTLKSYMDKTGILIPAGSGTPVTAVFDRDGRMSGTAGCNGYSAGYRTKDYSIAISEISSTKMFCPGPGIMDLESAFLADLSKTSSFRMSESTLTFSNTDGRTVLIFTAG